MLSAGRTANIFLFNKVLHLFLRPGVYRTFNLDMILCQVVFDQFVSAETLLTCLTVHQGIRKAAQMTRSNPGLGIHQNRTVNTYVVGAFLNKFLPPCFLYIVFQLYTKITIIPGVGKTAVNLGAGIYEASAFCQCYNFFHCLFHLRYPLFLYDVGGRTRIPLSNKPELCPLSPGIFLFPETLLLKYDAVGSLRCNHRITGLHPNTFCHKGNAALYINSASSLYNHSLVFAFTGYRSKLCILSGCCEKGHAFQLSGQLCCRPHGKTSNGVGIISIFC